MGLKVIARLFPLTVLFCYIFTVRSMNLHTGMPIIKESDEENSFFGYSVTQHAVINEESQETIRNVILVGAPKSQTSQPETNRPGAVYSCPLTTIRKDCSQLSIDQDTKPPAITEIKNDQWLGVTVKSQGSGGWVLVCAHRYVENGTDYQWGQGICFSLTQELDYRRTWEPCRGRPVSKAHEQYGYCQAGTSGEISEENDIIIGAPGPYTWRGTVFTNNVRFGFRDDRSWYMGPVLDEDAPVEKYSYLGMSTASGKFFDDSMAFVSGAPRSNGTGQVVFFTKHKSSTFKVQLVLSGEQFASSFGYTLAQLDINSDGRPDLVVGAPFYFTRNAGGAAYIYLNSKDGISESTVPLKLTGKPESRFSFALANAGDLNRDGFPDLAIGAPYEDSGAVYIYLGSEKGLIKEPSQVLRVSELNKIESLTKRTLNTFGYSLAGGLDLDGNGYPDLLVGAYESDTVILFRARPIIDIHTTVEGNLTNIDPSAQGCHEDQTAKLVCFSFHACFKFNSSVISQSPQIKLRYRIEAETFTGKKYYRVKFNSSIDTEEPNIVERNLVLTGIRLAESHCSKETVYLKDKSDIQNPIKFKMTYSIIQKDPQPPKEGDPLPDINRYPILNQQEASRIFEAKFLKDCGENEICESELRIKGDLSLPKENRDVPVLYLGEEQVNMSVIVVNSGEPAYDAAFFVTHPYSLSFIGKKVLRGHHVECIPYNGTVLKCELGNPFTIGEVEVQLRFNPKGVADDETSLQFEVKVNTTSNDKNLQPPLPLAADIVRMAEIELRGGSEPEQVFYGGEVRGESGMVYEDEIGSSVNHTYQITNHGPWKAKRVDVVIQWPFEVENGQPHGKWLLYMIEEPQVRGDGYCEMKSDQVNPLKVRKRLGDNLTGSEGFQGDSAASETESIITTRKRKKREVVIQPEELRMEGKTVKVVTMECGRSAKCFEFRCVILNLRAEQSTTIKIRSRLWNSTLVEDYPSVDWVRILSSARIELDPILDIKQKTDNDDASAETKAYPGLAVQSAESVSIWIYILAAIGGLFLLVLLIICLWKLGFFKRKKPGYMPANSDEKEINNL